MWETRKVKREENNSDQFRSCLEKKVARFPTVTQVKENN